MRVATGVVWSFSLAFMFHRGLSLAPRPGSGDSSAAPLCTHLATRGYQNREIELLVSTRNTNWVFGSKITHILTAPRTCLAVDEEQTRPGVGNDVSEAEVHVVTLRKKIVHTKKASLVVVLVVIVVVAVLVVAWQSSIVGPIYPGISIDAKKICCANVNESSKQKCVTPTRLRYENETPPNLVVGKDDRAIVQRPHEARVSTAV